MITPIQTSSSHNVLTLKYLDNLSNIKTYSAFIRNISNNYTISAGNIITPILISTPSASYKLPDGSTSTELRGNIILSYAISADNYLTVEFGFLNGPTFNPYHALYTEPYGCYTTAENEADMLTYASSLYENAPLYVRITNNEASPARLQINAKYIQAPFETINAG